jgi:drug/metabolite transporter (DMT)-like permease
MISAMGTGFLLLLLIHDYPATRWSAGQVLLLTHIAVVSTALGFVAWIEILRWLPAGTASLNLFAIPVIALLSSMALFGERLTGSEWAGIACIGAGLAVLTLLALRAPGRAAEVVVVGEGG